MKLARSANYGFSLEIEGDTFSLLGDKRAVTVSPPGTDIAAPLTDMLQQLIDALGSAGMFSTIRTVEYGEGVATQTLYVVGPGGTVEHRQRVVDAKTAPREVPATPKEMWRAGVMALVVLVGLFLVASLFFDVKGAITGLWRKITPVDTEAIAVDPGPYKQFIEFDKLDTTNTDGGRLNSTLAITLKPTAAYPKSLAEIERLHAKATSMAERRMLEALASGYVRVESYEKDKWQRSDEVRVAGLGAPAPIVILIPFHRERPPTRIVLTW